MRTGLAIAAAVSGLMALPALAGEAWDDLRPNLYEQRPIAAGGDMVALQAPYRTMTDPRTPIGATVRAPRGALIRSVSLIIDNNPMPVSAVFEMIEPRAEFSFSATMRINGPTPVRVVLETDAGALYMSEAFVKTSGVGACAAPPGVDAAVALATLGQMQLAMAPEPEAEGALAKLAALRDDALQSSAATTRARLSISHPSNSGLQLNQITLLYIPARYVYELNVGADGQPIFAMTGSISLSENPAIDFDLPPGAQTVEVHLEDTEGAAFDKVFSLVNG